MSKAKGMSTAVFLEVESAPDILQVSNFQAKRNVKDVIMHNLRRLLNDSNFDS